jgi:hypothetical protein
LGSAKEIDKVGHGDWFTKILEFDVDVCNFQIFEKKCWSEIEIIDISYRRWNRWCRLCKIATAAGIL